MVYPGRLKQYLAQCLAELFGTFILVFIGNLSVAQARLSRLPRNDGFAVNLSYSTGVYVALMVAGPISGAHTNPAVSLGLVSLRKMRIVQCIFYIFGQIMGAFLACAMVYLVYISEFNKFDGGHRQIAGEFGTAGIFYTTPDAGIPNWNCLIDSIVGTALLLVFTMALGNDYNNLISNSAKPFAFALMITTFGFTMGLNCGNPINPARDFGPRLFAACVYGSGVFRANSYYFWVPIIGPVIGAIVGVWIFEGYLILMRKYANLPGITYIDAIEQPSRNENMEKPRQSIVNASTETVMYM